MIIRDDYVKGLMTDGLLCARHCAENFPGTLPLNPHHHPMTLLVPIVQMKKQRHGEIKSSAEIM